jgi:hypothetical protein
MHTFTLAQRAAPRRGQLPPAAAPPAMPSAGQALYMYDEDGTQEP